MRIKQSKWAPAGLLVSATIWGMTWLPMRLLDQAGVHGEVSVLLIYTIVLAIFIALRPQAARQFAITPMTLLPIGLFAGWSNVGFILGVIDGTVMRVTLLFYLSPVWTIALARLLLHERLTRAGMLIMAVSIIGMFVILWRPGAGLPWPHSGAEWLGLSAGVSFAIGNVLSRRAKALPVEAKSLSIFVGMALVGGCVFLLRPQDHLPIDIGFWRTWGALVLLMGLLAICSSLGIQWGLKHTPATQATVILLFELVVASLSSWFIAGEHLSGQEWIGGALIIVSGLVSSRIVHTPVEPPGAMPGSSA